MMDYQNAAQTFDLESIAKQMLSGSLDALNACYECCDRHADGDKIALYWQGKDGRKEQYTFRELKEWSSQFANFLKSQGVKAGDRISGLLPRTPELIVTILQLGELVLSINHYLLHLAQKRLSTVFSLHKVSWW